MKANHPENWQITIKQDTNKILVSTQAARPNSKTQNYILHGDLWEAKVNKNKTCLLAAILEAVQYVDIVVVSSFVPLTFHVDFVRK